MRARSGHSPCRLCTGLFFFGPAPVDGSKQVRCISSPSFCVPSKPFASFLHARSNSAALPLLILPVTRRGDSQGARARRAAMGSGSCCCMGCNDDDSGGDAGGGLDPKGFFLAMMIAVVLFMLCHVRPPRRNSYVVYRCY